MTLDTAVLIPLPILVPLLAAAVTLILGRRPRAQRFVTVVALVASLAVAVALLYFADQDGIEVVQVGGWDAPFGISLVPIDSLPDARDRSNRVAVRHVVRRRPGHSRRQRAAAGVDLPADLSRTHGRPEHRVPRRRPVQHVRRIRGAPRSVVRVADTGSERRPRPRRDLVRHGLDGVVDGLPDGHGLRLRRDGNVEPGTDGVADGRRGFRDSHRNLRCAAGGLRHQSRDLPVVVVAARLLPDRPRPRHRGLRGPAHQGGRVRDHPCAHPDLPAGELDNVLLVAGLLTMVIGILGAIAQNDIKRLLSFTLVSHIGTWCSVSHCRIRPGSAVRSST